VQANQIASISLMAAILMLLVPLIELLLGRSKSIWRKAAAFVFWALALVYASERYVFTTCFVMGLVIVDSLVGARQTGQARRKIPLVYPAYTAVLLANAFWLQNSWLLVAVFVIAIAEHFFSRR